MTPVDYYWSSSRSNASSAGNQVVGLGGSGLGWQGYGSKLYTFLVRAVRAF